MSYVTYAIAVEEQHKEALISYITGCSLAYPAVRRDMDRIRVIANAKGAFAICKSEPGGVLLETQLMFGLNPSSGTLWLSLLENAIRDSVGLPADEYEYVDELEYVSIAEISIGLEDDDVWSEYHDAENAPCISDSVFLVRYVEVPQGKNLLGGGDETVCNKGV